MQIIFTCTVYSDNYSNHDQKQFTISAEDWRTLRTALDGMGQALVLLGYRTIQAVEVAELPKQDEDELADN